MTKGLPFVGVQQGGEGGAHVLHGQVAQRAAANRVRLGRGQLGVQAYHTGVLCLLHQGCFMLQHPLQPFLEHHSRHKGVGGSKDLAILALAQASFSKLP